MAADRTRKSDPVDAYVGGRIRLRRNLRGLSQTTLGEAVGVSFKQIQKYESGINRIGAGRLYEIGVALKVQVSYFFEGAPEAGRGGKRLKTAKVPEDVFNTKETIRLTQNYLRIPDDRLRKQFLSLVKAVAKG